MWQKLNKKVDEMGQENFNLWCGGIIAVFIIFPMFVVGISKWMELYLK